MSKSNPIHVAVVSCLLTALCGGLAWAVVDATDRVDRVELHEYVSEHSPWVREKSGILVTIAGSRGKIDKIEKAIGKLLEAQHELLTELRVLRTQLEHLINREN